MSTLHITLDKAVDDALESLAAERGTTPSILVAQIVSTYVQIRTPNGEWKPAPPDPLDAIVGKYDGEPVDDIDEVIYGR
jgi:hypothetical protein